MAIGMLGDPEEAADALQDAMISAFRRAGSFRGDCAVTTWLLRIVMNACLDRPLSDPSDVADAAVDVTAELRKLGPEQQAALVLVDMLGYSASDAAEVLGVSDGTVKRRRARGSARLLRNWTHSRPASIPSQDRRNRSAGPQVLPAQERSGDAP